MLFRIFRHKKEVRAKSDLDIASALRSKAKDGDLRSLEMSKLILVAEEVEEILLKSLRLFLEPVIKVLRVEVLKAFAHSAELRREV